MNGMKESEKIISNIILYKLRRKAWLVQPKRMQRAAELCIEGD